MRRSMLRAWTRHGRLEMIRELETLTRHAETLASQQRAAGSGGSGSAISDLLARARPMLAAFRIDAGAAIPRRKLATLHRLAVQQVARAERECQSMSASNVRADGIWEHA